MATTRTTTQRGYGEAHKRERARWARIMRRVRADGGDIECHATTCLEPSRVIQPGTRWDLGHTPDRKAWTGPEHMRCNRSDGGKRSRALAKAKTNPRSREW